MSPEAATLAREENSRMRASRPRFDRTAVWIFLFLLFVHLAVTRGHFALTDEVITYETTRSLVERGSLDIPSGGLSATYAGRDGKWYGLYSVGDSVAIIPLYLLGRAVDRFCVSRHLSSWNLTFATRIMGDRPDWLWGGTTEIFFVSLFNAFIVAAIGMLFYLLERRLGCSRRWAAAGALAVGIASQIAGLSSSLFEHPPECLLLLATFFALVAEKDRPSAGRRLAAGGLAGLLLLVRLQAAVALPALTLYFLFHAFRRTGGGALAGRVRRLVRPGLEFGVPIGIAIFVNCWIHFVESGAWSLMGGYGTRASPFTGPLYRGLYGYFLSPGQSIFLFTPFLLLLSPTFRDFRRRFPSEAFAVAGVFASYVLIFADLEYWHGLWCYGPRYLAATVPLLLLPLPMWLERGGMRERLAAAGLALAGMWMQATSLLVNYAFIFFAEGYDVASPSDSFLFDPSRSPVLTHSRALWKWSPTVDFWLLNVRNYVGPARMWQVFLPLAAGIAVSAAGLYRSVRRGNV